MKNVILDTLVIMAMFTTIVAAVGGNFIPIALLGFMVVTPTPSK